MLFTLSRWGEVCAVWRRHYFVTQILGRKKWKSENSWSRVGKFVGACSSDERWWRALSAQSIQIASRRSLDCARDDMRGVAGASVSKKFRTEYGRWATAFPSRILYRRSALRPPSHRWRGSGPDAPRPSIIRASAPSRTSCFICPRAYPRAEVGRLRDGRERVARSDFAPALDASSATSS